MNERCYTSLALAYITKAVKIKRFKKIKSVSKASRQLIGNQCSWVHREWFPELPVIF